MRIGCLRGSDDGEHGLDETIGALEGANCSRVVIESGGWRRQTASAFASLAARLKAGDTLVVASLEHLASGIPQLIDRLADLAERGVQLETLAGELDADHPSVTGAIRALHVFGLRAKPAAMPGLARPGRPRQLMDADIKRARALIEMEGRSVREVANELGVSRATLYRNIRGQV